MEPWINNAVSMADP